MEEFELTFDKKKACIYELEKAAAEIGNLLGSAIKAAHIHNGITKEEFWRNLFITKGTSWNLKLGRYMDDQPLKDTRFVNPQCCPEDPYREMDLQFWIKYLLNGGNRVINSDEAFIRYAEDSTSFFKYFELDYSFKGDYPYRRNINSAYREVLSDLKNMRNTYVGHITNKRIEEATQQTLEASLKTLMLTMEPLCRKNWIGKKYAIAFREAVNILFYQSLQEVPYLLEDLLTSVNLDPESVNAELMTEAGIKMADGKIYLNCDPTYFSNILKSLVQMDVSDEMWVMQLRRTQERKVDMQELLKLSVINEVPLSDKTQAFNTEGMTPEKLFEKAESGNVNAQIALAEHYFHVKQNPGSAFHWWYQAALAGNATAQCSVGCCYLSGCGTTKNITNAIEWFHKAAHQEDKKAQYYLGECYAGGNGVTKDIQLALSWYQKSAEQGYDKAQYELGRSYQNGNGIDKDLLKAKNWYHLAAEQGHFVAQNSLAIMLEEGTAGEKNPEAAFTWYRKAAEIGYVYALWNVGRCYGNGIGTEINMKEAVVWYRKAAEKGHVGAQYQLGYCYEFGKGVSKDPVEAITWYKKAAYAGRGIAQYRLAICYGDGVGTEKDLEKAAHWYREAADQNDAKAQNCLGHCYYNGYGVPKNFNKAVLWFTKAANAGNVFAQNNLALCYEKGYGTAIDLEKSMLWTKKALAGNDADQVKKAQLRYDRLIKLTESKG